MPTIDLTVARPFDDAGVRRRVVANYTGPVSYVTGGDSFAPGDTKLLGEIEFLDLEDAWNSISGGSSVFYRLRYDYVNQKVLWYNPTTGSEVAATTNLSTFIARFEAVGK